jgi:hypothetical protein
MQSEPCALGWSWLLLFCSELTAASVDECSCRRTRRWPRGRLHKRSIWRAIDWQRANDITDLQSVYSVHCASVTGGACLAGKLWITISLTAEHRGVQAGGSAASGLGGLRGADRMG